jgi:glycosyltransferase involved in cell wall biosynthesis
VITVVIVTFNEERNLPGCLASIAWCEDIVVIDSFSTDRTIGLALAGGARVYQRRFVDFADQRNHAHAAALCRREWVFHLDADERFTPALRAECEAIARAAPDPAAADGYLVAPRMIFMDRWIPRCTDYPAYQARFVRRDGFRFVQVGHGQREAPGTRLGKLQASYEHLLSAGDAEGWAVKHARYAAAEVAEMQRTRWTWAELWVRIRRGPALERRRALKRLWFRLPGRPLLRFLWQYMVRGGWQEGYPGYCYCRLLGHYEWLIARELRRAAAAKMPPRS